MTALESRILQDRLAQVMGWSLQHGNHTKNDAGNLCVMEAVAYVAGRPWSDSPPCVSNSVGALMRSWNDALPNDGERNRLLKPLITTLIGTATNAADEQRRAFMAMDWLIRVWTPKRDWSAHLHEQREEGAAMKIVINFVDPPIPDRRFDYCAYDADRYDGASDSVQPPVGWGRNRAEALADLCSQYEDELDEGERLDAATDIALRQAFRDNDLFDTLVDICRPVKRDFYEDDKTEDPEPPPPEPSPQTGFV